MYTNQLEKINVSDYLGECLIHLHRLYDVPDRVVTEEQAELVKAVLNNPENTFSASITSMYDEPFWGRQEVDYVPSNLGENRGYIYYFRCHNCLRRVRHLYSNSMQDAPSCRHCFRLKYRHKSRKALC